MTKKKDDSELLVSFSGLKEIFSDRQVKPIMNIGFTVLLLLIPLILSVYIRTLPESLPITGQWAYNSVRQSVMSNVASQVNQMYPNLPAQQKQDKINQLTDQTMAQQASQLAPYIESQSKYLKDQFSDTNGKAYLGDIDSYFWLRYARNLIEKGTYGDTIVDGQQYDNHMVAPIGMPATTNLYPYIEAFLYRSIGIFSRSLTYMQTAFYTPLFLSLIAIAAAFFIGKKLSGNLTGFIAAILVAVNPTILSRSLGSDNDIVNAVFPLLIMLFTIYAFDAKNLKGKAIFAALTGFLIGLYSFAWSGWWFMFLFILGAALIYFGYIAVFEFTGKKIHFSRLTASKEIRGIALFIGTFLISSMIFLAAFGNFTDFLGAFTNPFRIITIKQATSSNLWPNVYTTVAELNAASLSDVISSMGGLTLVWLAFLGTLLPLANFEKKRMQGLIFLGISAAFYLVILSSAASNSIGIIPLLMLMVIPPAAGILMSLLTKSRIDPIHSILMVIWFAATIYASTKGVRFILLIVPVFIISFSVFIGMLVDLLSKLLSKSLDISFNIVKAIAVIAVLIFLFNPIAAGSPINTGISTASAYVPSINDAWVQTLTNIKQNSAPNAIINSWWDFGHWFKYFADRSVTSDGASQNSPQAHWIGKVLLTSDEKQAIAILRMLDCGANGAFETLNGELKDTHRSIDIIYGLLAKTPDQARQELGGIVSQATADKIISKMYCQPPEDFFITSGDMVSKAGVWAHFGIWNFDRAQIYNYFRSNKTMDAFMTTLETKMNYTAVEAQDTYNTLMSLTTDSEINNWIAPWPSYLMQGVSQCSSQNATLLCPYGITVDATPQYIVRADYAKIYLDAKSNATIVLGIYDRIDTSRKLGEQVVRPGKVVYYENTTSTDYNVVNSSIGFDIVVQNRNGTYYSMATTPELTKSMFTRMFYLEGAGIKNFAKVNDVPDVTGSRIITWKVNWNS